MTPSFLSAHIMPNLLYARRPRLIENEATLCLADMSALALYRRCGCRNYVRPGRRGVGPERKPREPSGGAGQSDALAGAGACSSEVCGPASVASTVISGPNDGGFGKSGDDAKDAFALRRGADVRAQFRAASIHDQTRAHSRDACRSSAIEDAATN